MQIRKKVWFILLTSILLMLIAILLYSLFAIGGADFTKYPKERASHWVCKEPHFELNYKNAQETFLEWDGKKMQVVVAMQGNIYDVYRVTNPDILKEEDLLFRGTWKYVKGKMVFKISKDYVFDGAYKELVFVPQ